MKYNINHNSNIQKQNNVASSSSSSSSQKVDRNIKLSDLTNKHIYIIFGLLAHLYVIFSSSVYFALENEFQEHLGIRKETLVNYFCIFSIIFLLISLSFNWTWPIRIQISLIIIFLWILLGNLISKECLCCIGIEGNNENIFNSYTTPTTTSHNTKNSENNIGPTIENNHRNKEKKDIVTIPPASPIRTKKIKSSIIKSKKPEEPVINNEKKEEKKEEEEKDTRVKQSIYGINDHCDSHIFNTIYSVACIILMISSFLMNTKNYYVSMFFTVLSVIIMIFILVTPISCNQFSFIHINTNILKFTLYNIIAYLNTKLRLTEIVLTNEYLKSINIILMYKDSSTNTNNNNDYDINDNMIYKNHHSNKNDKNYNIQYDNNYDYSIPVNLFNKLEILNDNILEYNRLKNKTPKKKKNNKNNNDNSSSHKRKVNNNTKPKDVRFDLQLQNIIKLHSIHKKFKEKRWFSYLFSWKNRFYNNNLLYVLDLASTIWILNVCPPYLFFIIFQFCLILYHIVNNICEIKSIQKVVKLMDHIYKNKKLTEFVF